MLQRLPGPCPHETSRFKPSRTFRGPNATATRTIPRKTIGLDLNLIERTFSFQPSRTFRGNCNQCPGPPRNFLETTFELQGKPYGTHQNLAENCTGTFPKPCRTFLGTAREPVRNLPEPPTVGELTLDLSPPERNFSNRPEPPFELPAKPTGTLPGTAREPVCET